jgi:hypothetical protein
MALGAHTTPSRALRQLDLHMGNLGPKRGTMALSRSSWGADRSIFAWFSAGKPMGHTHPSNCAETRC